MLFASGGYKQTGAVLWPDYWRSSAAPDLQIILDVPSMADNTFESGQMVFDKKRFCCDCHQRYRLNTAGLDHSWTACLRHCCCYRMPCPAQCIVDCFGSLHGVARNLPAALLRACLHQLNCCICSLALSRLCCVATCDNILVTYKFRHGCHDSTATEHHGIHVGVCHHNLYIAGFGKGCCWQPFSTCRATYTTSCSAISWVKGTRSLLLTP